jgi:uncharacterized membrane protein
LFVVAFKSTESVLIASLISVASLITLAVLWYLVPIGIRWKVAK